MSYHSEEFLSVLKTGPLLAVMIAVLLMPSQGLANSGIADGKIVSAINYDLRYEGCQIENVNARHDLDLTANGKPEVLVVYSLSADTCGGSGSWSNSELAVLETQGNRLVVKTRLVPGRDQGLIDPYVQSLEISGQTIAVGVISAKPFGGGPITISYVYQGGRLVSFDGPVVNGSHETQDVSFAGLESCNHSSDIWEYYFTNYEPFEKTQYTWTFAANTEVMGLPAKAVTFGICGDGTDLALIRACGNARYINVTIAMPVRKAKTVLKRKTGINFRKEKLDQMTEATLRPVLIAGEKRGESSLYCDSGSV